MAQDLFHYDKMIERALRGLIRDALARVSREGLRSEHHFYIGFATATPGVVLPARLLARFPDEMTIVLQHQFWDLAVGDEAFSISLSFDKQVERLTIPYAAIRSFADPSVDFHLEFAEPRAESGEKPEAPAAVEALPKPARGDAQVVALDSFRKR